MEPTPAAWDGSWSVDNAGGPLPTVADLAAELGLPPDERMRSDLDAAVAWVADRRANTDPMLLWSSPRVHKGTILFAALLYQSRSTPTGYAGYDESGGFTLPTDNAMRRVYTLVGKDPVIA